MAMGAALAQRTIAGTITGDEGEALIGATVLVKGTSNGTITDIDGTYELRVSDEAEVLVISYTGYETQEVELGASNVVDVTLASGVTLEQVVVSGQGIGIAEKRLTSQVDVLDSRQLEAVPMVQLDQVLQSRLPGAQVRFSSGQPGTASLIRNRGPISALSATTPVIIIDGVRVDNLNAAPSLNVGTGGAASSALADIPIESIERVEFIRGGAATTLYGADAANGVIQIFTKKGTKGAARVSLESQMGFIQGEETFLYFPETADLYYETGFLQSHRLAVDGGGERVTYNFSGNFYDDDGFNNVNQQRRLGFRSTVGAKVSERVQYTGSAAFQSNYFTRDYNANTSFARYGNLEGGSFGDISALTPEERDNLAANLEEQGELTDITESVRRFQTSHTIEYNPFKNFDIRATVGLDSRRSFARDISTNALLASKGAVAPGTDDQGSINTAERNFLSVTGDFNMQYRIETGDFSFITGAGGQIFRNKDEQLEIFATNVFEGSETINNAADVQATDFLREVVFGGFYFSENIGWKNRLFLDAAIRFDGNSAYGEEVGLVDIFRLGMTYSLTDESFMQSGPISRIITSMRFRANYGQATNFPTPFANDRTFAANPYLGALTLTFGNPGDPNLGPEVVNSFEFGADMSFIDGRLGVSVTRYDNTTEDALLTLPSPPSSGQLSQLRNVGEISNEGWEFELDVAIIDKEDIGLNIGGSLVTNQNELVDAGGAPPFVVGGFTFLGSWVEEGQPLGYLRGARPLFDAEGNLEDVERNANLGDPNPNQYGAVNLNFRWKRFTLFSSADYQLGAQAVAVDDVLRYFGGVNDPTRIPANAANESFFDLAGVWVEDVDFFKIRNISLFYNFDVSNSALSRLQLGFNFRNPFVFGTSTFDPEVTGAGIGAQGTFGAGGFGFGTESPPKQYIMTLRLGF